MAQLIMQTKKSMERKTSMDFLMYAFYFGYYHICA